MMMTLLIRPSVHLNNAAEQSLFVTRPPVSHPLKEQKNVIKKTSGGRQPAEHSTDLPG